ncbi:MAG: 3-hydroxyacyl-CoA dehydrogenase, partial [Arthrobacter sp.]|nr:3-hydroxyacyl-CoA dehydrogenase [Arthrobacter sp.]
MTELTATAAAINAARKIAVVGSGYMGGGIAQVLALGGARVALADVSAEVAQKNYERLLTESDQFVADRLFPEGSTQILQQNLWAARDIEEAVADADFIEEAVPEVIAIKHETLARISAAAR